MAVINQFVVKDMATIRDDIRRTIKNGLYYRGVEEPNVDPGSDFYVIATALGNELAVVGANAVLKADAQMPDTAVDSEDLSGDQDLTRIASVLGLSAQPAAGSVGSIVLESSAASPIAANAQLTDDAGQKYEVTSGGVYANAALVPVRAVSKGEATNRAEGDILRWSSAPPYASERAAVAPGGFTNGADAEDSEALRARVLARFQVPPGSGNWEQFADVAEESTNSVLKAFVYPAILGPSTCAVAVVAAPTATNKSRTISSALLSGTVVPYMNNLPRFGYLSTTTVTDVNVDVSIGLVLPDAPTANPPGPGGGWVDGSPWPTQPSSSSAFRCKVTAVTSTTEFDVDADVAPTVNVSHIMWLSPVEWKLYSATVIAATDLGGSFRITIDKPFVGISVGCYIWPECENAQVYTDAILAQFASMGPGEKSANTSALGRGFRHPAASVSWPHSLGPHLLHAVINSSEEVASAQFFHRTDGTQTSLGSDAPISPLPPATLLDAPNIYVPRHIAFYRAAS